MLQPVQSSTNISHFADINANDDHSRNETLKVITCPICQAVYLPASTQQRATRETSRVLEAAFLRVCHFCFRCQRPACPQCWNPMHHVCVACGEEAHLPFLLPVPSLEGVVLAPSLPAVQPQMTDLPLVCLHNGRFCLVKSTLTARAQTITPHELALHLASDTPATSPEIQGQPSAAAQENEPITAHPRGSYPSWIQEIMERQEPAHVAGLTSLTSRQQAREDGTSPAMAAPVPAHESVQELSPENEQEHSEYNLSAVQNEDSTMEMAWPAWGLDASFPGEFGTLAGAVAQAQPEQSRANVVEWIENILIVVLATLLLALILMITLAVRSSTMNTLFLHLIHVDIRAEIAYLFQAI